MERLLLRPDEAAEIIGISRSRMYQLLSTGELPVVKVGNSLRVPLERLRAWIDAQVKPRAGSTPERI